MHVDCVSRGVVFTSRVVKLNPIALSKPRFSSSSFNLLSTDAVGPVAYAAISLNALLL